MKKKIEEVDDKKVIKLSEEERLTLESYQLRLENFQLRLELLEKTRKEFDYKKQELLQRQELFAIQLQKKYEVILDEYVFDLIEGKAIKK